MQSQALKAFWPDAAVFDPLKVLDQERPAKKPLLFATVGATLPFDRLVRSVAELKARGEIPEDVIVQTGVGRPGAGGRRVVETLPFDEVLSILREADIVVCHGGTGSLITALREGCRVAAMPRLFELGEHYDAIRPRSPRRFRIEACSRFARTTEDLSRAASGSEARLPVVATSEPTALTEHLREISGEACRPRGDRNAAWRTTRQRAKT